MRNAIVNYAVPLLGLASLVYALWPPKVEPEYIGTAGSLLGFPLLVSGARK